MQIANFYTAQALIVACSSTSLRIVLYFQLKSFHTFFGFGPRDRFSAYCSKGIDVYPLFQMIPTITLPYCTVGAVPHCGYPGKTLLWHEKLFVAQRWCKHPPCLCTSSSHSHDLLWPLCRHPEWPLQGCSLCPLHLPSLHKDNAVRPDHLCKLICLSVGFHTLHT